MEGRVAPEEVTEAHMMGKSKAPPGQAMKGRTPDQGAAERPPVISGSSGRPRKEGRLQDVIKNLEAALDDLKEVASTDPKPVHCPNCHKKLVVSGRIRCPRCRTEIGVSGPSG